MNRSSGRPSKDLVRRIAASIGLAVVAGFGILGCTGGKTSESASGGNAQPLTTHTYHGTASAGDFLNITVTPTSQTAGTIDYNDLSNNESGTAIPYAVNSDGSYTINDPSGNLVSAYEIPGYALLLHANSLGPNDDTETLVTAVESGPITLASLEGSYNYMQFGTQSGGIEVGALQLGASSVTVSGYSPYVAYSLQSGGGFTGITQSLSGVTESSDGTYVTSTAIEPDGAAITQYLFGTDGGYFIMASPNGSIIGLPQGARAFSSNYAGTYSGIFYQKTNAATGNDGTETGTVVTDPVSITINQTGSFSMTDLATGSKVVTGSLQPLADASYLYDGTANELADPCNGMFTFRLTSNGLQQDVFVTFISANGNSSILFSSFSAPTGQTGTSGYSYFYGIGLMGM
jgi:hypothetical protein